MIPLRHYQQEAVRAIYAAFQAGKRVLLRMPTGAGKTVTFAHICRDAAQAGKRFCIMVHRKELVAQAQNKLLEFGLHVDVIMADSEWSAERGQYVASVQTLSRRNYPDVDVLIVDEAHHAMAETYTDIVRHYHARGAHILGVTATPWRQNKQGFSDMFDVLVQGPTERELSDLGYLVIPRVFSTRPPDTSVLRVQNGDYRADDAAALMERNILYGDVVAMYRKHGNGGKVLGFAANVELSKRYATEYKDAGIPAAHVDGTTSSVERDSIFERFRNGDIVAVWNCNIVTEGFDVPDASVVQICVPTKSLAKYFQMVGRVMRPHPQKQHAIVLDHAGVTIEHNFVDAEREWSLDPIKSGRLRSTGALDGEESITLEFCAMCEQPRRVIALEKQRRQFSCEHGELCPLSQPAREYKHKRDYELEELHPETVIQAHRLRELNRLLTLVEEREYRTASGKLNYYWAWKTFLSKHRIPTATEIRTMRKRAKYHYMWEHHQLKEHFPQYRY